jgi:hypothetical protein
MPHKSGITHSLDFPIDVEYDTPPALDVLIAACRPHPSSDLDDYPDRESLFYPPSLPLTTTLELANHPILDAVRTTLFPGLPAGHHLTAVRDRLEVVVSGGRMPTQQQPHDGRAATLIVTLPVRFRGGALVVRDVDGSGEQLFYGGGGKGGDMEWTAFFGDCVYEIESVQKGCRLTLSFAIFDRTFGPAGLDTLINPSDFFLDLLTPILNLSRGRKIAFYLSHEYGVNPSEVLAESLVPSLKGGDLILYHAMRLYKLSPELHWTAGRYIWPVNRTVECQNELPEAPPRAPAVRGSFSTYGDGPDDEAVSLRFRVEDSGAVLLSEADIYILTDWNLPGVVGKERVPFVSGGELEKLVVNVLLVVYVP